MQLRSCAKLNDAPWCTVLSAVCLQRSQDNQGMHKGYFIALPGIVSLSGASNCIREFLMHKVIEV